MSESRLYYPETAMGRVAEDAIRLFIEYRDAHGFDEEDALDAAVNEIGDGLSDQPPVPNVYGAKYVAEDGEAISRVGAA